QQIGADTAADFRPALRQVAKQPWAAKAAKFGVVTTHYALQPEKRAKVPSTATGERRSEEHTSELQSLTNLVCRLLLEKKKYEREYEHLDMQFLFHSFGTQSVNFVTRHPNSTVLLLDVTVWHTGFFLDLRIPHSPLNAR